MQPRDEFVEHPPSNYTYALNPLHQGKQLFPVQAYVTKLERLRDSFSQAGMPVSCAVQGSVYGSQSVQSAPRDLRARQEPQPQ